MDVDKSFLIVAWAIERMAVCPTKNEKVLLNKIAIMIANSNAQKSEFTGYDGIRYNFIRNRFEGNIQINNKRKWFVGKTDEIVHQKINDYKLNIETEDEKNK